MIRRKILSQKKMPFWSFINLNQEELVDTISHQFVENHTCDTISHQSVENRTCNLMSEIVSRSKKAKLLYRRLNKKFVAYEQDIEKLAIPIHFHHWQKMQVINQKASPFINNNN